MSVIPGYVRDATDDEWPTRERYPGYRMVVVDVLRVPHSKWSVARPGKQCRFTVPDADRPSGQRACGEPAVVELARGITGRLFAYCARPDHLYGRRWDDGRLLQANLVKEEGSQ